MGLAKDSIGNNYHRALCALNSVTGEDKKIADFEGWAYMWANVCALNPLSRQLYSILRSPTGNDWHLTSANIDTLSFNPGPVLDSTAQCTQFCPQALFFA